MPIAGTLLLIVTQYNFIMQFFKAQEFNYKLICSNPSALNAPHPLLRDSRGDKGFFCISPHHGRSFVVEIDKEKKYVVSKGNGLSYSQYRNLYTAEYGDNIWGVLLKEDAIRDFCMGRIIANLGIKTNLMEYVLELDTKILLPNGHQIHPILLQYTVECPYRICDTAYMPKKLITEQVEKWEVYNDEGYKHSYLIASELLIKNLYILHKNNVLHNAIHFQNVTWALELLDFELACCPSYPHKKENSKIIDLFDREVIQTYEIISHIAWSLGEKIDYNKIDDLFYKYGFDLSHMKV